MDPRHKAWGTAQNVRSALQASTRGTRRTMKISGTLSVDDILHAFVETELLPEALRPLAEDKEW